MSIAAVGEVDKIRNMPCFGLGPQNEIITTGTLGLIGLLISDIVSHIIQIESQIEDIILDISSIQTAISELQTDVGYLMTHAVTSVISQYDPDGPCPGVNVTDVYEVAGTPDPGSGQQLQLRPLTSTDGSVTITYNPVCKYIDLKANSSATLTDHWSSGVDVTTGSRVIRYNLLNPGMNNNESFLVGIQDLNTSTSRQMFFDLFNTGAFRVGGYSGTEWYISNMGVLSFASGQNTIALGTCSFAGGGASNSALSDNSAIFGLSNLIDAENGGIFGGSYNSITGAEISDNGVIVGGSNNSFDVFYGSAAIAGSGLTGQMNNSFAFGYNAQIGVGSAAGGPVTGPITGSFAAFDASQNGAYYLDSDYTCKMMFKNGFIRGGGSRSYDGVSPTQIGNDGAREVYRPFRYVIAAGATKIFSFVLSPNQMVGTQGSILIASVSNLNIRGYFTFQDGIFTRVGAGPSVATDVAPTVTKILSLPLLTTFSISDIVFGTSGTSVTLAITAPVSDNVVVNVSLYLHDLMLS